MKSWNNKVIRAAQDKGSRFVVLGTNSCIKKVEHQINSSFDTFDAKASPKFKEKLNNWLEKWSDNIPDEWKEFIRPDNCNNGEMYSMVKTYKTDKPVSVITSDCNTVIEKLSISVEKKIIPSS